MTNKQAAELMENELRCVQRASSNRCDRDCARCDLLKPTEDIVTAYGSAIKALERGNKQDLEDEE